KKGPQEAEFSCFATGNGFVIWGGTIGSPDAVYAETSLSGFVSFSGKALVEEVPDLKGWYSASELDSIQSSGVLEVEWNHEGVVYSLTMSFYSTEETSGLFNSNIDSFTVPVFFVPEPPPREQFMSYVGVLTKQIGGVSTSQDILGWTALTVYKHRNVYRLVVIFELVTECNDFVTIAWLNKDFYYFSGASAFSTDVDLKKE
ncbi:MAG: hypothetical protein NWF13_08980, partial [Candidatus Bathyarchaeota archaeon]|nr:hypothetical protein [Candidatus Bathyarchaeota archaeon]